MIKSIKSLVILKYICRNIDHGRILDLFKYNKKIQNKLNINLIDYKRFSERYIIFDNNGKGKEYNSFNDDLIFEGDYLRGKRNGKGIEYNEDGDIIFEGEYLNGKRNGKGIEFNDNDILIYEGEYLNDKRHGKGKEFNFKGDLIFDGEYLNGEKRKDIKSNFDKFEVLNSERDYNYGKIKNIKNKYNKNEYIGEYINGKRNGFGKEYIKGKLIYEGEYLFDKKINGKFYDDKGNIIYEIINGIGKGRDYEIIRSMEKERNIIVMVR